MVSILKGATSQSVYLAVLDSASTTGGRKTAIAWNTAGLTAYYTRNRAAAVAIALATLASSSAAWSSGGFVEVDATNNPGLYRLDVPDAAFASGVDSVVVVVRGAAGMVQVEKEIQLTSMNLQDAVRAGLTALPNAAAEAAGGLFTRGAGAGQINQANNGNIDANTVRLSGTAQTARDLGANVDVVLSTRATPAQILVTPANLLATDASGRVTVGSIVNGAIAAATFAANALDAVWSTAARTLTAFGFNVTVGTNNDKTGYALSAAGVQAIWDALTSALATASSIGKLLVDNINATISSRGTGSALTATQVENAVWDAVAASHVAAGSESAVLAAASAPSAATVAAAVRTNLTTELARIDVAISSRASGAVGGVVGSGSKSWPVTVTRPDGVTPVEGVAVWVTTDSAGTNAVAGTIYTDTLGRINTTVGFMLDPGAYYLWRQHGLYNFANPTSFTVT